MLGIMSFCADVARDVARVRARLAALRRRRVWSLWLAGALLALGALAVLLYLNALWAIEHAPARTPARLLFALSAAAALGLGALPPWTARRYGSLLHLARLAERRDPALCDRLSTSLELAAAERNWLKRFLPQLLALAHHDAARAAAGVPLWRLACRRRLAAAAAACVALCLLPWLAAQRTAYTLADLARVYAATLRYGGREELRVEPGDVVIAAGDDLTVRAISAGRPLREAELYFRTGERGGEYEPMTPGDGGYAATLRALRQSLVYAVRTRHARSPEYRVTVAKRPSLVSARVYYAYPPYTRLPARMGAEGEGNVRAVAGTRAEVYVRFDMPVRAATLALDSGAPSPVVLPMTAGGGAWSASFLVATSGSYTVAARSADHDLESTPVRFAVEAVPDATPTVELLDAPRWQPLPADRQLTLRYTARDDFGLRAIDLLWRRLGDETPVRKSLAVYQDTVRETSSSALWQAPGQGRRDIFELWLEAFDGRPDARAGMGRSRSLFIGGDKPPPDVDGRPGKSQDPQQGESAAGGGESGAGDSAGGGDAASLGQELAKAAEQLQQAADKADRLAARLNEQSGGKANPEPGAGSEVFELRRHLQAATAALDTAHQLAQNAQRAQPQTQQEQETAAGGTTGAGGEQPTGSSPGSGDQIGETGQPKAGDDGSPPMSQPPAAESGGGTSLGAEPAEEQAAETTAGSLRNGENPGPQAGDQPAREPPPVLPEAIDDLRQRLTGQPAAQDGASASAAGGLDQQAMQLQTLEDRGESRAARRLAERVSARLAGLAEEARRLAAVAGIETGRGDGGGESALGADDAGVVSAQEDQRGVEQHRDLSHLIKDEFGPAGSASGEYALELNEMLPLIESGLVPERYREAVGRFYQRLSRPARGAP